LTIILDAESKHEELRGSSAGNNRMSFRRGIDPPAAEDFTKIQNVKIRREGRGAVRKWRKSNSTNTNSNNSSTARISRLSKSIAMPSNTNNFNFDKKKKTRSSCLIALPLAMPLFLPLACLLASASLPSSFFAVASATIPPGGSELDGELGLSTDYDDEESSSSDKEASAFLQDEDEGNIAIQESEGDEPGGSNSGSTNSTAPILRKDVTTNVSGEANSDDADDESWRTDPNLSAEEKQRKSLDSMYTRGIYPQDEAFKKRVNCDMSRSEWQQFRHVYEFALQKEETASGADMSFRERSEDIKQGMRVLAGVLWARARNVTDILTCKKITLEEEYY
jgi:hypothetical protein